MLKVDSYNFDGKKKEAIVLPTEYDVKPNDNALSHAIHVYEDRSHVGFAKAKTRGEVAISTRKIYKQKGTGGARHGAKSAPIFVGGGAAHGPTGVKRILHVLKLQGRRALLYALNYKIKESKVVFVDGIEKIKKTKDAANLVSVVGKEEKWSDRNILVAVSSKNSDARKFFRNIGGVNVDFYGHFNAYRVFLANGIIIDKGIFEDKNKGELKKDVDGEKIVKTKSVKAVRIVKKAAKNKVAKK